MTLTEARTILELGLTATRQEITRAYRRAARRWHPDRAPEGREEEYRAHMQQVNAAYQRLKEFLENYRFHLEDMETGEDVEKWWQERFYTGVWGRPPQEQQDSQKKGAKQKGGKTVTGKDQKGSF